MPRSTGTSQEGPCEAMTDWVSDKQGIYGVKCHKPGTLRMEFLLPYGTILCDDCYVAMKKTREATDVP